jgi:hypothetical protein
MPPVSLTRTATRAPHRVSPDLFFTVYVDYMPQVLPGHSLTQNEAEGFRPTYTLRVLEELFFIPVISSVHVTHLVGGQVKTGQRALEKLQSVGILRELNTGRQRNKLYASDEIHKLVTS